MGIPGIAVSGIMENQDIGSSPSTRTTAQDLNEYVVVYNLIDSTSQFSLCPSPNSFFNFYVEQKQPGYWGFASQYGGSEKIAWAAWG